MKRLKYLFAGLILLVSMPAWRLFDWANVILPWQIVVTFCQVLWISCFIIFPLKLLLPKLNRWMSLLLILFFGSLSWIAGPLTSQTTLDPNLTHCGRTSYSGFFHPIREVLSNVHFDDLEVRNQMCWLVKMVIKVPPQIPPEDLAHHLNMMKFKLLKPEHKYKVALPWITFLLGKYLKSTEIRNSPLLVQNLGYWTQYYSELISSREYAWYEWPHSAIIKAEYGFIERNWENIQIEFSN